MQIETYSRHRRADLGLSDSEWERLRSYVDTIADDLAAADNETPSVRQVEESPPAIRSQEFRPGGWIGEYPGGIEVVSNRLDRDEEQALIDETSNWIELLGADTFEASFPVSTDVLIDRRTQVAGYSEALINLTEIVRSNRLPVTVNKEQRRGTAPKGRPALDRTMRLASQGSREVVAETTEFSFDTPANHLLVRFHADLSAQMRSLSESYSYYGDAFDEQLSYHEAFLNEPLPSRLLDAAIDHDFTDPAILSRIRRESTAKIEEIVDLWEAYQRSQSLDLRLRDNLNTAIKPISKIYELWCLGRLIRILTEVTGSPPKRRHDIVGEYRFGSAAVLYYNRRIPRHSKYLGPALGVGSGEPDFALEVDGKLAWIGDAKFKTWDSLRLSDYQRFITYLVDFQPVSDTGTILYVDASQQRREQRIDDFTVEHISLRPGQTDPATRSADDLLTEQFADLL